jgi:hypothetical protein
MPVSRSGVRLAPFTTNQGSLKVWKPPDRWRSITCTPWSRGVWQLPQPITLLTR